MDETQDQVQEDSPVSEATGPPVLKKDESDQVSEEQSETTEDAAEEAKDSVYKDHLGRELTGEQLHEEYMKTQGYITKLEDERKQWEQTAQQAASTAVSEDKLLKDVDPNVREAIVQIVTPVIEDSLKRRDVETQRKAQDTAFTTKVDGLKTKYSGGDGLPKFDEVKVLAAMQDPSNSIFDPEAKFKEMNEAAFIDYYVKQAIKGKSSDTKTEDTGGSSPRKPQGKVPQTWDEAAKSALSRV